MDTISRKPTNNVKVNFPISRLKLKYNHDKAMKIDRHKLT